MQCADDSRREKNKNGKRGKGSFGEEIKRGARKGRREKRGFPRWRSGAARRTD